jgi:diguanylate cyclase (GGDEF)-like protein
MGKPQLSIRATVLWAIVIGMVLPALLFVLVDQQLARQSQESLVERNRSAAMVLAVSLVTEPAWSLNEPALRSALARVVAEPSVCDASVTNVQPGAGPITLSAARCAAGQPRVERETAVLFEGQQIAGLKLAFDGQEIDRLLAERRRTTLWMVAAQVLFGVLVLAGVLSVRLLRPIGRLRRQAAALSSPEPVAPLDWERDDELGQLGRHLGEVHTQIRNFIGELEAKNTQLQRLAMHDQLTGLPNRRLLRELFEHAAATARRDSATLALLFIDLDNFKSVNDTHGHAAGDELLVAVSQRLAAALRETDVICRVGGDEFLVLLPRVTGWEHVALTAERLLNLLVAPVTLSGTDAELRVSGSIGIALYPTDGGDFDALARTADLAMYRSKDLGRARYSFFHPDLDTDFRARLALETELAEALEQGQFILHFQTVTDLATGRVVGSEALVRWQHPRRGLLAPGEFIAAAERTGLIHPLGRWTLDAACAQFAASKAAGQSPGRIAVNMSASQAHDPGLPQALAAAMRRHGIAPGELELELTEGSLLTEGDASVATLAALRSIGVLLALDDFGTGHSSLSYLKRLRPDKLKIDGSFVRDLPGDGHDRGVVEAIISMGRALQVTVVAEGVETTAQSDWLKAQGCVIQQGFLFSRPQPVEAALPATAAAGPGMGTPADASA